MKQHYLLAICIPTYNRPCVVDMVQEYLKIKDSRLCIRVYDNHSTDGTWEKLRAIQDNRLILYRQPENRGFGINSIMSLRNAEADYVLFDIDKNYLDIDYIARFIEILPHEKPNFGFITTQSEYILNAPEIVVYKAGIDAIVNGGGYACRHPVGYFYRSDLFDSCVNEDFYDHYDPSFAFPFDIVSGELGGRYDATVINMPIGEDAGRFFAVPLALVKTLSYNEENFYFGKRMTLLTHKYFMESIIAQQLPARDKQWLLDSFADKLQYNVSVRLHSMYQDADLCKRYSFRIKKIGFIEMFGNVFEAIRWHKSIIEPTSFSYKMSIHIKSILKTLKRIIKCKMQDIFHKD